MRSYLDAFNEHQKEAITTEDPRVLVLAGDKYGGFSDIWLMDRIFQTIKKSDVNLLMEEERRLFYVALTRAKEKVYLLTGKGSESRFIDEIPVELMEKHSGEFKPLVEEIKTCTNCKSKIEPEFSFCPFCGLKIPREEE